MAALIKAPRILGETVLGGAPPNAPKAGGPKSVDTPPAPATPAARQATVAAEPPRPATPAKAEEPAPSFTPTAQPVERESEEALRARIEKAHREALSALEAKAHDEGYDAGFAKGEAAGRGRYAEAIEALTRLVAKTDASVADVLATAEETIGAIVFEATCKVIGDRLITAEGAREAVAAVLARAKREDVVAVRVSPQDLAKLAELAPRDSALASLKLEADDDVELGGCIVQLKGGHLDGRIETQFRAFAQSLKEAALRHE